MTSVPVSEGEGPDRSGTYRVGPDPKGVPRHTGPAAPTGVSTPNEGQYKHR